MIITTKTSCKKNISKSRFYDIGIFEFQKGKFNSRLTKNVGKNIIDLSFYGVKSDLIFKSFFSLPPSLHHSLQPHNIYQRGNNIPTGSGQLGHVRYSYIYLFVCKDIKARKEDYLSLGCYYFGFQIPRFRISSICYSSM